MLYEGNKTIDTYINTYIYVPNNICVFVLSLSQSCTYTVLKTTHCVLSTAPNQAYYAQTDVQ